MTKKKSKTFEESLEELEEIVEKLSGGDLPLEESITLFEKGIKLRNELSEKLSDAKSRIKVLVKDEDDFLEKKFEDELE